MLFMKWSSSLLQLVIVNIDLALAKGLLTFVLMQFELIYRSFAIKIVCNRCYISFVFLICLNELKWAYILLW